MKTVQTTSPSVSQWQAAKYYLQIYKREMPFHWVVPIVAAIGMVTVTRIPALLLADMISQLQNGEIVDHNRVLLLAMTCAFIGESIMRILWHFVNRLQVNSIKRIYDESLTRLLDKSLDFHDSNFAGSTTSKVGKLADGAEDIHDIIADSLPKFFAALLFAGFILGREGLPAIIMLLGAFAIYMMLISPLVRKRTEKNNIRTRKNSDRTGMLIDTVTNVLPIKSFVNERHESERFGAASKDSAKAMLGTWDYNNWAIFGPTAIFYVVIAYVPLLYLLNTGDELDAGSVFIMFYALNQLAGRIWDISFIWEKIETTLSEAAEGLEMLNEPSGVTDVANAKDLTVAKAAISFTDADFSYTANDTIFSKLRLEVDHTEKIGLVGTSGGGKTTLVKLIMRYMDATGGTIAIDGQDISNVTQASLRQHISYIPQEPALFHRTLRENIAYGNNQATDDEIIAAAKKAHAHDFIKTLPEQYDTLVGERGIKLSGGQRQRVAIARSFLKNAPILILDEATSALDSESESLIQESLVKLMDGKTVISIAHRLSTLQIMDRILVIDDGAIAEEGTHETLLAQDGIYKKLWAHQSGDYIS